MAVSNTADVGLSGITAALQALDGEISECDDFIRVNERWETRVEEYEDERAGLHVDEGENLEKAKLLQIRLAESSGEAVHQGWSGVGAAAENIANWVQTVEAASGASGEGDQGDETSELCRIKTKQAVDNVLSSAQWLKDHGHQELGAEVEKLVVVKVEATADVKVGKKTVTVSTKCVWKLWSFCCVQVLVGAENHRSRLEELLKRRRLLTGN